MQFDMRSFLGRHERFYLIAARASVLEPLTDSPDLLTILEQGYGGLMSVLMGTLLEPYAQAENAATLYHGWMAEGARADFEQGGTRLSTRHAPPDIDLGNILDEISITHALLGDTIALSRKLVEEGGVKADAEELLLVGLNLEIVERKEDHLADPGVLYQLRDLRKLYDALRRGAGPADPVATGRRRVCQIVGTVFLAYTLYRTLQAAYDDLAIFAFRTGTLKLKAKYADPSGERLLPEHAAPAFLEENLEKMDRARAAFRDAAERLSTSRFSEVAWGEDGALQPLSLALAQQWDDRGLLGRVAAADLSRLCRGTGPLSDAVNEGFIQATRGVRGMIAIGRLSRLADDVRSAHQGADSVSLDEVLKRPGSLMDRVADCEKALKEQEQALSASARRLRDEVTQMNIDHSGLLDPAIEHLIHFMPSGGTMTAALAQDLLFFSRRAGALYEPIQAKLEEVKQHCRYLRELHMYQEGQLLECARFIDEGDLETAKTFFAPLEWVFDDLDYAGIAAPLGMEPKVPVA